jgi:hypothetical protein
LRWKLISTLNNYILEESEFFKAVANDFDDSLLTQVHDIGIGAVSNCLDDFHGCIIQRVLLHLHDPHNIVQSEVVYYTGRVPIQGEFPQNLQGKQRQLLINILVQNVLYYLYEFALEDEVGVDSGVFDSVIDAFESGLAEHNVGKILVEDTDDYLENFIYLILRGMQMNYSTDC